jgi:hypothetical protein
MRTKPTTQQRPKPFHGVHMHLGIHVKRDNRRSIAYSEELIFPISATLQSTDRHQGIVGQEYCHFQRDS